MTLLAIDPGRSYKGEATIGYALFSSAGDELDRGYLSFEKLSDSLYSLGRKSEALVFNPPRPHLSRMVFEIVIEDFVNDPQSARGGQRNGTSECIGAVEILALQADIPFTRQRSAILGPAKLLAGYVQKLKHLPHQDSAYLHGYYYLVQKGVLQSKGLADTLK